MVTVTGAGSTWTSNSTFRVGNSGTGSLMIANGGQVMHNSIFAPLEIGTGASGTATVTGTGSSLTTVGTLYVGSTGTGALGIQNGGSVTSGRALIRGLNSGSGQVLVAGAGSTWNVTNVLEIGLPEPGFTTGPTTLTINPGAMVTVGQEIDLDTNGVVRLQGGTLTAKAIQSNDLVSLNYEGTFEWTSGTLHVGTIFGSATNQGGRLAPGLGAGRTTIGGNYTQQAPATMEIQIGGTIAETQHDFVSLEGAASLNGQLQLALINSFIPTAG
jgi:T5SS/PEP-CTERM-associated repeat protein